MEDASLCGVSRLIGARLSLIKSRILKCVDITIGLFTMSNPKVSNDVGAKVFTRHLDRKYILVIVLTCLVKKREEVEGNKKKLEEVGKEDGYRTTMKKNIIISFS